MRFVRLVALIARFQAPSKEKKRGLPTPPQGIGKPPEVSKRGESRHDPVLVTFASTPQHSPVASECLRGQREVPPQTWCGSDLPRRRHAERLISPDDDVVNHADVD